MQNNLSPPIMETMLERKIIPHNFKEPTRVCNAKKQNSELCSGILKVGLSPFKKVNFICFYKSPLKVMKNAFYLMLKALFVLEIFIFLSRIFGCVEKRFDKKAKVNFKICDVTD